MPMIFISFVFIVSFIKMLDFKKIKILSLDKIIIFENHREYNDHSCKRESNIKQKSENENEKNKIKEIFYLFAFTNFLANFLVVSTIANIQIINRVLTANPILYFFCSDKLIDYKINDSKIGKFILIIFISYSIIGCVMQPSSYGFA